MEARTGRDPTAVTLTVDEVERFGLDFIRAESDVPMILCPMGTPLAYGGRFGPLETTPGERESIARQWQDEMSRLAEGGREQAPCRSPR